MGCGEGAVAGGMPILCQRDVSKTFGQAIDDEDHGIAVDNRERAAGAEIVLHIDDQQQIIVSRKATGTLVIDNLQDGRNLYLIGTGTGLAQFLSVIKDPETYERFEKVVLLHGCRRVAELAYGEMITEKLPKDELIGDLVRDQLIYYPTVTRDPFRNRGRITDLMTSGKLFSDVGFAPLAGEHDRVMICGSPALVHDMRALLAAKGFVEGNHGEPGQFVVEKAFAER